MRLNAHLLVACLIAGLCTPALAQESGSGSAEVDLSSPKAAAMTMVDAARKGDAEALKQTFAAPSDSARELIEIMSPMMAAAGRMTEVSTQEFGEPMSTGGPTLTFDTLKEIIEGSDVQEQGDNATIVIDQSLVPEDYKQQMQAMGQPGMQDMQLVKMDGDWKLSLSAMGMDEQALQQMQGPQAEQMKATFKAMTEATKSVTEKITAGEYENVEQAQQAFQAEMMEAMQQMMQEQGGMGGGMGDGGMGG